MKRTLIELAMLIGLPVMAYFGFVQGVDGALYLVKFSVCLVRVDRRRGELWAIDCAVGSLQVKMYNDGLTDCMWQEAQLLQ